MASLMLVNPRKKRRKTARANPKRRRRTTTRRRSTAKRRVRRNPLAANPRRRRRTRRNPKLSIQKIQREAIMPAATGAVGALALDIAWGSLPIPDNFKTGMMGSLAKIAGAIVLGQLAGNFVGRKTGEAFTVGAVTIQAYNAAKNMLQTAAPGIPLGEYPTINPYYQPELGYAGAGTVLQDDAGIRPYSNEGGMGAYLSEYVGYGGGNGY